VAILRFDPFRDSFHEFDRLTSQLRSGVRMPLGMPMDVWRSEYGYIIELDLPGVDPGSIELTCERNELTVRAERRPSFKPDDEVVVAERPQGGFTRQLVLGEGLDTSSVSADYADGVLRVTIKVAEAAQPRRIEVNTVGQPRTIEGTTASVPTEAESAGSAS
jgi:HSP20 family protein